MSNNVGVFGWIREGVRRAVLLGFSDAVEQIGAADDKDALHPQLQSLFRKRAATVKRIPSGRAGDQPQRTQAAGEIAGADSIGERNERLVGPLTGGWTRRNELAALCHCASSSPSCVGRGASSRSTAKMAVAPRNPCYYRRESPDTRGQHYSVSWRLEDHFDLDRDIAR